jgi:alpha-1,2-mannosyltransferase
MRERLRRAEATFGALGVAVVAGVVTARLWRTPRVDRVDFHLYRAAARAWRPGNLSAFRFGYNGLRFTYPPFGMLVLRPVMAVPGLEQLWLLAGLMAALVLLWGGARGLGTGPRLAAVAVGLLSAPVLRTLRLGQVDLVLAVVVLADLFVATRGRRWAGLGIGFAGAIKLLPLLAVGVLVARGHYGAARRAIGTVLVATTIACVVAPVDSWTFWTTDLFRTSRIGQLTDVRNQSISGLLARLLGDGVLSHGLGLGLGLGLIALAVAGVRASRFTEHGATCAAAVMVAGSLAAPMVWTHHVLWALPLGFGLVGSGGRWRPLGVVLLASLILPIETSSLFTGFRTTLLAASVVAASLGARQRPSTVSAEGLPDCRLATGNDPVLLSEVGSTTGAHDPRLSASFDLEVDEVAVRSSVTDELKQRHAIDDATPMREATALVNG